jgi:hypothetical protein
MWLSDMQSKFEDPHQEATGRMPNKSMSNANDDSTEIGVTFCSGGRYGC